MRTQTGALAAPLEVGGSSVPLWIGHLVFPIVLHHTGGPSELLKTFKPKEKPDLDLSLHCESDPTRHVQALSSPDVPCRMQVVNQWNCWVSFQKGDVDLVLYHTRARDHLWASDELKILIHPSGTIELKGNIVRWALANLERTVIATEPESIWGGLRRLIKKKAEGWNIQPGLEEQLLGDQRDYRFVESLIDQAPVDNVERYIATAVEYILPEEQGYFKARVMSRHIGLISSVDQLSPPALDLLRQEANQTQWSRLTGETEFNMGPLLHLSDLLAQLAQSSDWLPRLVDAAVASCALPLLEIPQVQEALPHPTWRFKILELAHQATKKKKHRWVAVAQAIRGKTEGTVAEAFYAEIPEDYPIEDVKELLKSHKTPMQVKARLLRIRAKELPNEASSWRAAIKETKDLTLWAVWMSVQEQVPENAYVALKRCSLKDAKKNGLVLEQIVRLIKQQLQIGYPAENVLKALDGAQKEQLKKPLAEGCGEGSTFAKRAPIFLKTYGWCPEIKQPLTHYLKWAAKKPTARAKLALKIALPHIANIDASSVAPLIQHEKQFSSVWPHLPLEEQAIVFARLRPSLKYWKPEMLDHLPEQNRESVIKWIAPQLKGNICSLYPYKQDIKWLIAQVRKLPAEQLPTAAQWNPALELIDQKAFVLFAIKQIYTKKKRPATAFRILCANPSLDDNRWIASFGALCEKFSSNRKMRPYANQLCDLKPQNTQLIAWLLLIVRDHQKRKQLWQTLLRTEEIDPRTLVHLYEKLPAHIEKEVLIRDIQTLRKAEPCYWRSYFTLQMSLCGLEHFTDFFPEIEGEGPSETDVKELQKLSERIVESPDASLAEIAQLFGIMHKIDPQKCTQELRSLGQMMTKDPSQTDLVSVIHEQYKITWDNSRQRPSYPQFLPPLMEAFNELLQNPDKYRPLPTEDTLEDRTYPRLQELGKEGLYHLIAGWGTLGMCCIMAQRPDLYQQLTEKSRLALESQQRREEALLLLDLLLVHLRKQYQILASGTPSMHEICLLCEHLFAQYATKQPVETPLEKEALDTLVTTYTVALASAETSGDRALARWNQHVRPLYTHHREWLLPLEKLQPRAAFAIKDPEAQ